MAPQKRRQDCIDDGCGNAPRKLMRNLENDKVTMASADEVKDPALGSGPDQNSVESPPPPVRNVRKATGAPGKLNNGEGPAIQDESKTYSSSQLEALLEETRQNAAWSQLEKSSEDHAIEMEKLNGDHAKEKKKLIKKYDTLLRKEVEADRQQWEQRMTEAHENMEREVGETKPRGSEAHASNTDTQQLNEKLQEQSKGMNDVLNQERQRADQNLAEMRNECEKVWQDLQSRNQEVQNTTVERDLARTVLLNQSSTLSHLASAPTQNTQQVPLEVINELDDKGREIEDLKRELEIANAANQIDSQQIPLDMSKVLDDRGREIEDLKRHLEIASVVNRVGSQQIHLDMSGALDEKDRELQRLLRLLEMADTSTKDAERNQQRMEKAVKAKDVQIHELKQEPTRVTRKMAGEIKRLRQKMAKTKTRKDQEINRLMNEMRTDSSKDRSSASEVLSSLPAPPSSPTMASPPTPPPSPAVASSHPAAPSLPTTPSSPSTTSSLQTASSVPVTSCSDRAQRLQEMGDELRKKDDEIAQLTAEKAGIHKAARLEIQRLRRVEKYLQTSSIKFEKQADQYHDKLEEKEYELREARRDIDTFSKAVQVRNDNIFRLRKTLKYMEEEITLLHQREEEDDDDEDVTHADKDREIERLLKQRHELQEMISEREREVQRYRTGVVGRIGGWMFGRA